MKLKQNRLMCRGGGVNSVRVVIMPCVLVVCIPFHVKIEHRSGNVLMNVSNFEVNPFAAASIVHENKDIQ